MVENAIVRVIYPCDRGKLTLRIDQDWQTDIEAVEIDADEGVHLFHIPLNKPYIYFKPCFWLEGLLPGQEPFWSQGTNYLAVPHGANGRTTTIYPFFMMDDRCSVCSRTHFDSEHYEKDFAIRVFLPPGYDENELARFPVVYMQDGQNLFFAEEAFMGRDWRIPETLGRLNQMNATHRVIVVGITPTNRMAQYTKPGYERYGRFIAEELKPMIDREYRTLSGPKHTCVMGSSLGGVASFYLAWQYPDLFGMAGCLSSTFGYCDDLIERVQNEPKRPLRIYLDSGYPKDNYEATRAMRGHLLASGYQPGGDLFYLAFPYDRHNEAFWAARCHIPLQFFFPRGRHADMPPVQDHL